MTTARVTCPRCGTGKPAPNAQQLADEHNRIHHNSQPTAQVR